MATYQPEPGTSLVWHATNLTLPYPKLDNQHVSSLASHPH